MGNIDLDKFKNHEEIIRLNKKFTSGEFSLKIINSISEIIFVVNIKRQVVFYNKNFLDISMKKTREEILGNLLGNLFRCEVFEEGGKDCGKSAVCKLCGFKTLVEEVNETLCEKTKDISYTVSRNGIRAAYDFRATVIPFNDKGEHTYFLFIVKDIHNEKRRESFERTFFHDVLNTVGSLSGFIELLNINPTVENLEKNIKFLNRLSKNLIDEIVFQRDLKMAENGKLEIWKIPIMKNEFLDEIKEIASHIDVMRGKEIVLNCDDDFMFMSDNTILKRVIINLIKNAAEASCTGDEITVSTEKNEGRVFFHVHNIKYIPEDIRLKIFRRSFSTKGEKRGLGTYSARLFTENYLNGKIYFESYEDTGTTFTVEFPSE